MMPNSYDRILQSLTAAGNATLRESKSVGSKYVSVSNVHWGKGHFEKPPTEYYTLVLYRTPARLVLEFAGDRRPVRQFVPGDLVLRPPGTSSATEFLDPVDISVLAIKEELITDTVQATAAQAKEVLCKFDARPFRSTIISSLAERLADMPEQADVAQYCDSLAAALIHELWHVAEGDRGQGETGHATLSALQISLLDEVIFGGAVADKIAGMATSLGLSLSAFTAALKRTSGLTPHQFVLSRRVALARDLVQGTRLPLQDIAWRAGFSSQSHMTDVFRTKLGTSPGKLRAAV